MALKLKENWLELKDFLRKVWIEADPKNGNIVWPSKKEIWQTTLIVIITIAIVSIYVGILDYIFAWLLKIFFKAQL